MAGTRRTRMLAVPTRRRSSSFLLAAAILLSVTPAAAARLCTNSDSPPPPAPETYGEALPPAWSPGDAAFVEVDVFEYHSCGRREGGAIECWGDDSYGKATPPAGTFSQISTGLDHSCALRTNGEIACWGDDDWPISGPPAGPFIEIAAGNAHSCALRTDGEVACWGYPLAAPTPPGPFTQITSGNDYSCALDADGEATCWGDGGGVPGQTTPGPGPFLQIEASDEHTCALRTDGEAECWGSDFYGQSSPPAGPFTTLTVGELFTCALRLDGEAVCWGNDEHGESTPAAGPFQSIAAGREYACGIRTNGEPVCWGKGSSVREEEEGCQMVDIRGKWQFTVDCPDGVDATAPFEFTQNPNQFTPGFQRMIDSTVNGRCATAYFGGRVREYVECERSEQSFPLYPTAESYGQNQPSAWSLGDPAFVEVDVYEFHSCGLLEGGEIECWGDDSFGQATPPAGPFSQIAVGQYHGCALRTLGEVACWGEDGDGQSSPPAGPFLEVATGNANSCALRADGEVACWGAPLPVPPPEGPFTQITGGNDYYCVLTAGGEAACWGDGGGVPGQTTPGPGPFLQIAASSGYHTCALRTDGEVECWGDDTSGQSSPPPGPFTALTAGERFTCALRPDGEAVCWGNDDHGASTPVAGPFASIAAGMGYACGIRTSGEAVCWGVGNEQTLLASFRVLNSVATPFHGFLACNEVAQHEVVHQWEQVSISDVDGVATAIEGIVGFPVNRLYEPDGSLCFEGTDTRTCTFNLRRTELSPINRTVEPLPGSTITFENVSSEGDVTVVPLTEPVSSLPVNFQVSDIPVFFAVETEASVSGEIRVCLPYPDEDGDGFVDGTSPPIDECSLRLLHEEGADFVDRTDPFEPGVCNVDAQRDVICAVTASLSQFVYGASTEGCGNGEIDDGEQCDLGAGANGNPTTCCTDSCQYRSGGDVCRTNAGECDGSAEVCSGTDGACPTDVLASAGTPCTDDGNGCTVDECDGFGVCGTIAQSATCSDDNPCTIDSCNGTVCESTDQYCLDFVDYKATESDKRAPDGALAKGCVVQVDDPLFGFGDAVGTEENYVVSKVSSIGLPASKDGESGVDLAGVHLLGLAIKPAPAGALPVADGEFPKGRKHARRSGVVARIVPDGLFLDGVNTVRLDTIKATRLLVPANAADAAVTAAPSTSLNHYKCYKAKAAKLAGTLQDAGGKERRNLQLVIEDRFADGNSHPTYGGARLLDISKVAEICNPVSMTAIDLSEQDGEGATRSSSCNVFPASVTSPGVSLLCWKAKVASKAVAQPWDGKSAGAKIDPKQNKHTKRTLKTGSELYVGQSFSAPDRLDTKKEQFVCLSAEVIDPGL